MRPRVAIGLVLALGLAGSAPGQTLWFETLGADGPEQGWAVREADDGTILLGGTTQEPVGHASGLILRLDLDGSVLETRSYLAQTSAFGSGPDGVGLLGDGGAILTGRNVHDIFETHHAWIARVDATGDVVWSHRFFTGPDPTGRGRWFLLDASPTSDGGVIASGLHSQTDGSPAFPWIVKFDAAGVIEWQRIYGSGERFDARAIIELSGGGYAVTGIGEGAGLSDFWVMKIGTDGSPVWEMTIGGANQDDAAELVELPGGDLAVVGWTSSFATSGRGAWVVRVSDPGVLVWNAVLGDSEWSDLEGIAVAGDGDLLVQGRIGEPGFPSNDFWLLKLAEADGSIAWQRAYEGDQGDWGAAIAELSDGTLAATGSWAWGFDEEAVWAARLGPDGTIPGCALMRDTAVAVTSARATVGGGAITGAPVAVAIGTQDFAVSTSIGLQSVPCTADSCPNQGNVLFAVRRDDDVELSFPGAPASEWHLDRDTHKTQIGATWLPPVVPSPIYTDVDALLDVEDYYYYLRGVCGGVAGP